MTTRGLTFAAESVRALMTCAQCGTLSPGVCPECGSAEKAKTQTRRVMKLLEAFGDCGYCNGAGYEYVDCGDELSGYDYRMPCRCCIPDAPHKPGNILYVKEKHMTWSNPHAHIKSGLMTIETALKHVVYEDNPMWSGLLEDIEAGHAWHIRSSRFMPRWAARIWLEITDVRAEWLQDISEEEARREGIRYCDGAGAWFYDDFMVGLREDCDFAAEAYLAYWDSLYDKRPERQSAANPMVWVYGLKSSSREAAGETR